MLEKYSEHHRNYIRIEKAIQYLIEHQKKQPSLSELAQHLSLSEFHLQRIFSEWAGISPKQFLQVLSKEHAKEKLKSCSTMKAAHAVGLSGSSRLHDLFIHCESITPGEYKTAGLGLDIHYGIHSSPFGYCFIAVTPRGICQLSFFDSETQISGLIDELKAQWFHAQITENQQATHAVFEQIFQPRGKTALPLRLILKGSPFQIQVWQALLTIPAGEISSYQHVADNMGKSSAVRAVASAVAKNNVAFLIPCHRVIRSSGVLNNYRWGPSRKAAMLVKEDNM
ncbi:MAG: methylated-DNA--[protein]-cysteine S-methyltransferase [Pseudomonadales bacterium]|nr:methylated-DNA--[protein]-cysteine S-methyltransferase [Pseudomonadales bacterium]